MRLDLRQNQATAGWKLGRILLLAAWFLCVSHTSRAQEANPHPEDPTRSSVSTSGWVPVTNAILKTMHSAEIASQIAGVLTEMRVQEGDRVEPGQILGRIHDEAVLLQVQRAELALMSAQLKQSSEIDLQVAMKSSAVASNELERAVRANQRVLDTYPVTEIDRLKLVADRAELEIARARHARDLLQLEIRSAENELHIAKEVAKRHKIVAPLKGVVVSVAKNPGEWIELGGRLLQIVSTDKLRIDGFIDQSAANIVDDRAASVEVVTKSSALSAASETTASIAGKYEARVVFVSPEVNPLDGRVRVFLEVDNALGKLRPGQQVQVQIRATP